MFNLNRRLQLTMTVLNHEFAQRKRIQTSLNEFKLALDQILDCFYVPSRHPPLYLFYPGRVATGWLQFRRVVSNDPLGHQAESYRGNVSRNDCSPAEWVQGIFDLYHGAFLRDGGAHSGGGLLQYVQPTTEMGRFVAIVHYISMRLKVAREKECGYPRF